MRFKRLCSQTRFRDRPKFGSIPESRSLALPECDSDSQATHVIAVIRVHMIAPFQAQPDTIAEPVGQACAVVRHIGSRISERQRIAGCDEWRNFSVPEKMIGSVRRKQADSVRPKIIVIAGIAYVCASRETLIDEAIDAKPRIQELPEGGPVRSKNPEIA